MHLLDLMAHTDTAGILAEVRAVAEGKDEVVSG